MGSCVNVPFSTKHLEHPYEQDIEQNNPTRYINNCNVGLGNINVSSFESNSNIGSVSTCRDDHNYQSHLVTFKMAFINVCGLMRKLLYPEFVDYIKMYDVVCIAETKLDDIDIVNVVIEDYNFFCKNRISKRKSGGVGIFVKKDFIGKKTHHYY